MTGTLRHLLIQRAARLQERPALTAPEWGTLSYFQFRNRVEGVALGLMAQPLASDAVFSAAGTAWGWISEVAAACCGLRWDPAGPEVEALTHGGARFNDEEGRQAYHDREHDLDLDTPFLPGLSHGELLRRLQHLNRRLGWDHDTRLTLPVAAVSAPEGRAALWSALFAGAHAELVPYLRGGWDSTPFVGFFSERVPGLPEVASGPLGF